MFTVYLGIPDIGADNATEAAKRFLESILSADWSSGLGFDVENHETGNVSHVQLSAEDVELILRADQK